MRELKRTFSGYRLSDEDPDEEEIMPDEEEYPDDGEDDEDFADDDEYSAY